MLKLSKNYSTWNQTFPNKLKMLQNKKNAIFPCHVEICRSKPTERESILIKIHGENSVFTSRIYNG